MAEWRIDRPTPSHERAAFAFGEGLGRHAAEVDAIDDSATASYRKYGFVPLEGSHLHRYLPPATIRGVCGAG